MDGQLLIYLLIFMPILGAVTSYLVGRKTKQGRNVLVYVIAILEFIFSVMLLLSHLDKGRAAVSLPKICGMGLAFETDNFRVLYVAIAALMWLVTLVFSTEYFAHYRNRNRYYFFQLITLGATQAIFLSADLYTTFVFFEVMSLASYVWVVQDEKKGSMRAGATYLAVAIIGGLAMLMGLFLLYHQAGTLVINELYEACQGKNVYVAAACLFVGFGAKAGAFPLQIWLPKAHPVAPAPASALLSGILTKTGIFGVLVISCKILMHDAKWGTFVLIVGTITMLLGAVLAVFSIDFKRTLACSSVSQIGFILVGIGMQGLLGEHNALAARGTLLHMVNHSLFKLVLFLVAGVIFMNLHKLNLNEIRGFGRKKPLLAGIYLMGALGIGGIPLWSGYISKTLLHESIVEYMHEPTSFFAVGDMQLIEWIFLISGGLTVAYMCKLFVAVFLEKNVNEELQKEYDAQKKYVSPVSAVLLSVCALLFPIMGMFPGDTIEYFAWINLKGSLISIAIGVAVYFLIIRTWMMKKNADGVKVYVNKWSKYLDLENYFYRPILLTILPKVCGFFCIILDHITDLLAKIFPIAGSAQAGFFDTITDAVIVFLRKTIYRDRPIETELEEGNELTHAFGGFLNGWERLLNKTIWRKSPHKKDFEHQMVLDYSSFKENSSLIGRSLSYGLIIFCLGLCFTLIYLLIAAFL